MNFDACLASRVRENVRGAVTLYVALLGCVPMSSGIELIHPCDLL